MSEWPPSQSEASLCPDVASMIAVAEQSRTPILFVSGDSKIRYANPTAQNIPTIPPTTDTAPSIKSILGQTIAPVIQNAIREVLVTCRDSSTQISLGNRTLLALMFPLREHSTRPTYVALVLVDITDKEQQRLQHQLVMQKELTATLMKEFRHTLKNKLQGVVGLLRYQQGVNDQCTQILEKVVTQLLTISNVYGIEARLDEDRIYVCSIVNEIIGGVHHSLPIQRLEKIKQVALNDDHAVPIALIINELITNAVKHTCPSSDARVDISVETDRKFARLNVFNSPAHLSQDINIKQNQGVGSGLQLASALLPPASSDLQITQQGNGVMATLTLYPPTVDLSSVQADDEPL